MGLTHKARYNTTIADAAFKVFYIVCSLLLPATTFDPAIVLSNPFSCLNL